MDFVIVLAALCFLMFVAYRGYSVILFAPVAALGAVLFTDPGMVAPMFTSLFMDKMVGFVKNYFPVFLLRAVFIMACGMSYLEWMRRRALAANEGYGTNLVNEPAAFEHERLANPLVAILPLVMVGVMNKVFTNILPAVYGEQVSFMLDAIGTVKPVVQNITRTLPASRSRSSTVSHRWLPAAWTRYRTTVRSSPCWP